MSETQLREKANKFAEKQMGHTPHDYEDVAEYKEHMVDYLIAKLLGKDPYKCFCDQSKPIRVVEDGTQICCECEKPIE